MKRLTKMLSSNLLRISILSIALTFIATLFLFGNVVKANGEDDCQSAFNQCEIDAAREYNTAEAEAEFEFGECMDSGEKSLEECLAEYQKAITKAQNLYDARMADCKLARCLCYGGDPIDCIKEALEIEK